MAAPLLIDFDPGIDHVVSLFYAARHFDLVQTTTTHGNASLATTTRNALRLMAFGGIGAPVASGSHHALIEARHSAELFHGDDGLGGIELPEPARPAQSRHAVEAIIETARTHHGALVVACLGPLTNLALALQLEPRLSDWISLVTLMGGSHGMGHMTPTTEFNFWCDPEAAAIVCNNPVRTRIVGYDVTRTVGFTESEIARLSASGRRVAGLVAEIYKFNLAQQRSIWGLRHAPIHSVLALVPLVRPDLCHTQHRKLAIELTGTYTRGMSVYDDRTLQIAPTPPFEYLPANDVESSVWVDPAAVDHVIETLLGFD